MFVQGKNLAFSLMLHMILIGVLLLYFILKTPPLPLLPQKRVVSLSVMKTDKKPPHPVLPPSIPVTPPPAVAQEQPDDSITEAASAEPMPEKSGEEISPEIVEQLDSPVVPAPEKTADGKLPENKEASVDHTLPNPGFAYSVNNDPLLADLEDPVLLPGDDFLIDDLLIQDEKPQEGSDSLYSIELTNNRNRKILDMPEILFDMKDPILGTLDDCRIGFSVTEEGLVRDINMIPPGTGSETYDEILENILSRFLFTPGDREKGTIAINFSRISGEEID